MKNLLPDLSAICDRYRIDALYLFGSRAGDLLPFQRERVRMILTEGAW